MVVPPPGKGRRTEPAHACHLVSRLFPGHRHARFESFPSVRGFPARICHGKIHGCLSGSTGSLQPFGRFRMVIVPHAVLPCAAASSIPSKSPPIRRPPHQGVRTTCFRRVSLDWTAGALHVPPHHVHGYDPRTHACMLRWLLPLGSLARLDVSFET